jgi:hypothetical protein
MIGPHQRNTHAGEQQGCKPGELVAEISVATVADEWTTAETITDGILAAATLA